MKLNFKHFSRRARRRIACGGFVDFATSNPFQPQGAVGGGNVFNAAPLFGASTISDSGSSGDNGASVTPSSSASQAETGNATSASSAGSGLPTSTGIAAFFTQYKTVFLIGGIVTGVLILTGVLVKLFRK